MIGSIIDGRYKVLRQLGAGGMGAVFEAEHQGTGRRVAVKLILSEELKARADLVERFQREARAAGGIETKHIAEVIDTGIDPSSGNPYMAMELMRGEDCSQLVRRVGPLSVDVALRITAQACVGLRKAHEAGVIHRDIKPANLFLAERDEGEVTVKILDFGIAKVKMEHAQTNDHQLTQTGAILGSPLYMAPEQARGRKDIDRRADLWSLGVVLYQLLCGRTPYHHIQALSELIIAICSEPPANVQAFAPWVQPEVAAFIRASLINDRDGRFQSAGDMSMALRLLLPSGYSLNKDELTGVTESARVVVAELIDDTHVQSGSDLAAAATDTKDQRAITEIGLAATQAPRPASVLNGWGARWAAIVLGAAVGAGGLFFYLRQPPAPSAPSLSPSTTALATEDTLRFTAASPLTIMADSFSGYSTFRSDRFAKILKTAKIPIKYVPEPDQKKRLGALENASADLVATSLEHVILNAPKGKIVALIDTTVGADAVVVNNRQFPQLVSLDALQMQVERDKHSNKKPILTFATGTPSEFLARLLSARLQSFNIDDFEIAGVSDAKVAWSNLIKPGGGVAAAVLWEPFVTRAREAGYRVVLSSGDVPGAIQDVLVASNRLLDAAPNALQEVVSAYYRHIDRTTANPSLMYRQVAKDGELKQGDAKAVVAGIRFATALAAKKSMEDGSFAKRIGTTAAVLVIDGQLDQPPKNVTRFFDARFVVKAAENTLRLVADLKDEDPKAARLLAEGGEQNVKVSPVDAAALRSASVIGQLGQLHWNPKKPASFVGGTSIDDAATKLEAFSHLTTVVTIEGGGGEEAEREAMREALEKQLRRRGLSHQVAVMPGAGFGSISVGLRRRPSD